MCGVGGCLAAVWGGIHINILYFYLGLKMFSKFQELANISGSAPCLFLMASKVYFDPACTRNRNYGKVPYIYIESVHLQFVSFAIRSFAIRPSWFEGNSARDHRMQPAT